MLLAGACPIAQTAILGDSVEWQFTQWGVFKADVILLWSFGEALGCRLYNVRVSLMQVISAMCCDCGTL